MIGDPGDFAPLPRALACRSCSARPPSWTRVSAPYTVRWGCRFVAIAVRSTAWHAAACMAAPPCPAPLTTAACFPCHGAELADPLKMEEPTPKQASAGLHALCVTGLAALTLPGRPGLAFCAADIRVALPAGLSATSVLSWNGCLGPALFQFWAEKDRAAVALRNSQQEVQVGLRACFARDGNCMLGIPSGRSTHLAHLAPEPQALQAEVAQLQGLIQTQQEREQEGHKLHGESWIAGTYAVAMVADACRR